MTQPLPPTLHDVVIAWLHGPDNKAAFTRSLVELVAYDMPRQQRINPTIIDKLSAVNISSARNAIVREFLDEYVASWLLILDADMGFKPDLVERILASADPKTAPIVGGLCFGVTSDVIWPTMYRLRGDGESRYLVRPTTFPLNTLVQVDATGAACLLLHRDALTTIGEKFDGAFPWFQETALGREPLGEDLTFCLRAGDCGIPIHVDTGVRLDHHKGTVLNLERYTAQFRVPADA